MHVSPKLPRVIAIAASLVLGACAGTTEPVARGVATARDDRALAAPPTLVPLELPSSALPMAPWLAPPEEPALDPFDDLKTAFVGMEAALARMRAGTFALHHRHGLVGPLRPPGDVTWFGLDGKDRVLAATSDGTLLRAEDVIAARDGRFDRLGAVPGARAWDAGTRWIAAATRSRVLVSSDEGQSFRDVGPDGGGEMDRVFVRSDGAVVAQETPGEEKRRVTWVAAPGRRLRRSPLQFDALTRTGAWIFGVSPCPAVLSADSARWARIDDGWSRDDARDRWLRVFSPSIKRVAYGRDFEGSLVDPAPPPPPTRRDELLPDGAPCRRVKPPRVRMGATPVYGRCERAAYLAGVLEPSPPARVELALLRDGRCNPTDEDPYALLANEGACRADAPLTAPPSVAVLDRRTGSLSLHRVPEGCRPEQLLSVGGVGVLLCASSGAGSAAVYVADASGVWNAEGALRLDASDELHLSPAPDGTLLLRAAWAHPKEKRAFVRSPRPLGDPAAWREVDVSSVFEVRVDVGGALVLFGTDDRSPVPTEISLVRDAPGEPRRTLATHLHIDGSLADAAIEGRRVVLWQAGEILTGFCNPREAPADHRPFTERLVSRDGSLLLPR